MHFVCTTAAKVFKHSAPHVHASTPHSHCLTGQMYCARFEYFVTMLWHIDSLRQYCGTAVLWGNTVAPEHGTLTPSFLRCCCRLAGPPCSWQL
jgi:hypothetical protein